MKAVNPMRIAFAFLCTLVGLSMGLAFNWPVILFLLTGLFAGTLPLWLPLVRPRLQAEGLAEIISLSLLIIAAAGICVRALLPVLSDQAIQIEAAIPLLFLIPPLYLIYIILNHMAADQRATSVTSHLRTVFLGPPVMLALAMGVTLATYTLIFFHYLQLHYPAWVWFADKFLERGIIPPLTLMLFFWGLVLFTNKVWMLKREQRLLTNPETRNTSALERARQRAMKTGTELATDHFLETLWKKSQDSYNLPRYINWAIPILGFIGTVLGISLAADGIQNIISSQSGLSQFSEDLGQAIAPLGIAFDTTLIALSLSVVLMLMQTMLQRWEDNLLMDYENALRNP